MITIPEQKNLKWLRIWLISGVVLITCMVLIGGITRLTDSGLSMTEWKIIGGSIPPTTDEAWQEAFDKYKNFPEYKIVNYDMQLSEFKKIFFWEYFHRMWGRMMGVVFIVPFIIFWRKKVITGSLLKKCIVILIGGATVGGLGWFMVLSGLQDRPDVSHFRLAIHLSAAFTLLCFVYYTYLSTFQHRFKQVNREDKKINRLLFVLVAIQIVWGAFTAGLDAGSMYNTYPLMDGALVPDNAFVFDSFIKNIADHKDGVQLVHRYLGTIIFLIVIAIFIVRRRKKEFFNKDIRLVLLAIIIQFTLGVVTILISKGGVPVWIGAIHQIGAIFVLLSLVNHSYKLNKEVGTPTPVL